MVFSFSVAMHGEENKIWVTVQRERERKRESGLQEGNPMTLSFPIDPVLLLINNGNHNTSDSK